MAIDSDTTEKDNERECGVILSECFNMLFFLHQWKNTDVQGLLMKPNIKNIRVQKLEPVLNKNQFSIQPNFRDFPY